MFQFFRYPTDGFKPVRYVINPVRCVESVLCNLCLIMATYMVFSVTFIHIAFKIVLALTAAAFTIITTIDMIATSYEKPIFWNSWLLFAFSGGLLFMLCAGILLATAIGSIIVLVLGEIINAITGILFLIDAIFIICLMQKHQSKVGPDYEELSERYTETHDPKTDDDNATLSTHSIEREPSADRAAPLAPIRSETSQELVEEEEVEVARPGICLCETKPVASTKRSTTSYGGTFPMSKDAAPLPSPELQSASRTRQQPSRQSLHSRRKLNASEPVRSQHMESDNENQLYQGNIQQAPDGKLYLSDGTPVNEIRSPVSGTAIYKSADGKAYSREGIPLNEIKSAISGNKIYQVPDGEAYTRDGTALKELRSQAGHALFVSPDGKTYSRHGTLLNERRYPRDAMPLTEMTSPGDENQVYQTPDGIICLCDGTQLKEIRSPVSGTVIYQTANGTTYTRDGTPLHEIKSAAGGLVTYQADDGRTFKRDGTALSEIKTPGSRYVMYQSPDGTMYANDGTPLNVIRSKVSGHVVYQTADGRRYAEDGARMYETRTAVDGHVIYQTLDGRRFTKDGTPLDQATTSARTNKIQPAPESRSRAGAADYPPPNDRTYAPINKICPASEHVMYQAPDSRNHTRGETPVRPAAPALSGTVIYKAPDGRRYSADELIETLANKDVVYQNTSSKVGPTEVTKSYHTTDRRSHSRDLARPISDRKMYQTSENAMSSREALPLVAVRSSTVAIATYEEPEGRKYLREATPLIEALGESTVYQAPDGTLYSREEARINVTLSQTQIPCDPCSQQIHRQRPLETTQSTMAARRKYHQQRSISAQPSKSSPFDDESTCGNVNRNNRTVAISTRMVPKSKTQIRSQSYPGSPEICKEASKRSIKSAEAAPESMHSIHSQAVAYQYQQQQPDIVYHRYVQNPCVCGKMHYRTETTVKGTVTAASCPFFPPAEAATTSQTHQVSPCLRKDNSIYKSVGHLSPCANTCPHGTHHMSPRCASCHSTRQQSPCGSKEHASFICDPSSPCGKRECPHSTRPATLYIGSQIEHSPSAIKWQGSTSAAKLDGLGASSRQHSPRPANGLDSPTRQHSPCPAKFNGLDSTSRPKSPCVSKFDGLASSSRHEAPCASKFDGLASSSSKFDGLASTSRQASSLVKKEYTCVQDPYEEPVSPKTECKCVKNSRHGAPCGSKDCPYNVHGETQGERISPSLQPISECDCETDQSSVWGGAEQSEETTSNMSSTLQISSENIPESTSDPSCQCSFKRHTGKCPAQFPPATDTDEVQTSETRMVKAKDLERLNLPGTTDSYDT